MADEFYGRSYGIESGSNIAGAPVADFADIRLHFDGKSATVGAGESFMTGAYIYPFEEVAGADVKVSWAIECGPASAGRLDLRGGLDPTWDYYPASATEPLGVVDVTGEQTVVVPFDRFPAAALDGSQGLPSVLIACVSGSIEIVQVKLRVWPTAGPRGAWALAEPYSVEVSDVTAYAATYGSDIQVGSGVGPGDYPNGYWGAPAGDPDRACRTAFDDALLLAQDSRNAMSGTRMRYERHTLGARADSHSESIARWTRVENNAQGYVGKTQLSDAPGYMIANYAGYQPSTAAGGLDPREIAAEAYGASTRAIDGGAVIPQFGGWTGHLGVRFKSSWTGPGVVQQHTLPGLAFETEGSGLDLRYYHPYVVYAGGAQTAISPSGDNTQQLHQVPIAAGGPRVAIALSLPGLTPGLAETEATWTPADNPDGGKWARDAGGSINLDPDASKLTFLVAFPPFEYYDPSLPWQDDDEPTPRFFWKDDLDQWRAIGPGKPADDPVLFKIKTAMGIYSEPRPGDEPGSGAHPLRVKVDNGSGADSWDTPVWMEPQD